MPNRPHDEHAPSRPAPRRPAFALNTPVRSSNERSTQPPTRQFASAPRFLLRQDDNNTSRDGVDRFLQRALVSPFGHATASRTVSPRRAVATPTPRRTDSPEIAEDEIEEEEQQQQEEDPGTNGIERWRDDTPFEDPFAPPDPNKKRRLSPHDAEILADDLPSAESQSQDIMSSFSAQSPPSPEQEKVRCTLVSPFPHRAPSNRRPVPETPAPPRRKFILESKTPKFEESIDHGTSAASQTPAFRSPPRYIVSGNYTASAADEPPTPRAGGSSSNTRVTAKRPTFFLPSSPSPPDPDNANSGSPPPAPFSPTSTRGLGCRGPPKSAALGYVAGGMAEQVRNWILEMGMKREQQPHGLTDPGRYSFTAGVECCRYQYLVSSGPIIIVHATQVPIEITQKGPVSQPALQRNILLLGEPTYSGCDMQRDSSYMPRTSLKNGNVVGIHSGLAWEIELGDDKPNVKGERKVIASSQSPTSEKDDEDDDDDDVTDAEGSVCGLRKWQVAAEWDLLVQS